MSLLLASALAANVVAAAEIDLASPSIYVSNGARDAIASGMVDKLACFDLPARSRKYRTACLTTSEWQAAGKRAAFDARRRKAGGEESGVRYEPVPTQSWPNQPGGVSPR